MSVFDGLFLHLEGLVGSDMLARPSTIVHTRSGIGLSHLSKYAGALYNSASM